MPVVDLLVVDELHTRLRCERTVCTDGAHGREGEAEEQSSRDAETERRREGEGVRPKASLRRARRARRSLALALLLPRVRCLRLRRSEVIVSEVK